MPSLAELQNLMQTAIIGYDAVPRTQLLRELKSAQRTSKDEMLDVYFNAYRSRLSEILEDDLEIVARYLGEELFGHVAAGYLDTHPSDVRNARYFSRHAAQFLAETEPFSRWPQVADLAAIELALGEAFDAAEATPFNLAELVATPADAWERLHFRPHPSLRRIDAKTNAFAIWTAMRIDETEPPTPRILDTHEPLLVWREDATSRLRALDPAEARGLDTLCAGHCVAEAAAVMEAGPNRVDADGAVAYFASWVAAGLLIAA